MFDDIYALAGRPFQLTPDPVFYFPSATHRKAMSCLSYGLSQAEGFIVITGEAGAGKSTLAAHLMATIDQTQLTAAQVVSSRLDGEELVRVVARSFGCAVEEHDKASALGAIESFLHAEARSGRRCLLVVDESQHLTSEALEELRMLSNFQLGSQPLLQTLLLGEPEFRTILNNSPAGEPLRQRVIASHHLVAMGASEIQPYVEHRMGRVGWAGYPGFDPRIFTDIYAATGGIPGDINRILNRLLLLGGLDQRGYIDSDMLEQVMADLASDGTIMSPAGTLDNQTAETKDFHSTRLDEALAPRDPETRALEQAVIEPEDAAQPAPKVGEFDKRIKQLEGQINEQNHMIKHTLTMLIEWIEAEGGEGSAA